jgi:hypothetical protein
MHTLFVREHNRLCDLVREKYKYDQEEMIFQHARKLICGIHQYITYNEFLPSILGEPLPSYKGYDDTVNPAVATEFSTVGYRLGHSMLSDSLRVERVNPVGSAEHVTLKSAFFNPSYVQKNGVDGILLGASKKRMQEIDHIIVEDVRSFLFNELSSTHLLDLASLNIQRGRDHRIPGYGSVCEAYGTGVTPRTLFQDLPMDRAIISKLSDLYDSVDDIDPWVGALCETHTRLSSGRGRSPVGPLVKAILTDQFVRSRDGDRFWYRNDPSMTVEDLELIENTTLGSLLNLHVPGNPFSNDVFHHTGQ